jgi:hypothetical protein
MNEASTWRLALARKLAPYYCANPKVAAVTVEGSVAQGFADRFSDIDLAVFWTEPPTREERKEVSEQAGGSHWRPLPSNYIGNSWLDHFVVGVVSIDVRHLIAGMIEGNLSDVLERADPSLPKQQFIAALLSALPLANQPLVTKWQQKAAAYPHELAMAMVREHLSFRPGWELEMLAERNDVLVLYDSFCTNEKYILLVLMGLNHIYYPGFRRVDRLMEQMPVAPRNLASRFKQVFGIVSIDPRASVYQIHDLIEETFHLVETHLGEIDTTPARERFREL